MILNTAQLNDDTVFRLEPVDQSYIVELNYKYIKKMSLLKEMVEFVGNNDEIIPIMEVPSESFLMIIDYCKDDIYSDENGLPLDRVPCKEQDIDVTYFKDMLIGYILRLMTDANYLGYQYLIDACAMEIANRCRGKTTEELRILFGIPNDLTPPEEDEILRNQLWKI